MRDLGYHERLRAQRQNRWNRDIDALDDCRSLLDEVLSVSSRITWRIVREAVRAVDRPATDRLEWRGRCHRLNGRTERVTWPGGQATRHTVHLRERARCLLMGRDYPIAGPSGWLP